MGAFRQRRHTRAGAATLSAAGDEQLKSFALALRGNMHVRRVHMCGNIATTTDIGWKFLLDAIPSCVLEIVCFDEKPHGPSVAIASELDAAAFKNLVSRVRLNKELRYPYRPPISYDSLQPWNERKLVWTSGESKFEEEVLMGGNKSDADVRELAQALRSNNRVRYLELRDNPLVTEAGWMTLLEVIPYCAVEWVDMGDLDEEQTGEQPSSVMRSGMRTECSKQCLLNASRRIGRDDASLVDFVVDVEEHHPGFDSDVAKALCVALQTNTHCKRFMFETGETGCPNDNGWVAEFEAAVTNETCALEEIASTVGPMLPDEFSQLERRLFGICLERLASRIAADVSMFLPLSSVPILLA